MSWPTPLAHAARAKCEGMVKMPQKRGCVDRDSLDRKALTPLPYAAEDKAQTVVQTASGVSVR